MRQSVQELMALYQNNLFAVAFNICENAQDAEDVVQDTFVRYYTIKKEFDNEQHARAWLIRVTINKAKNINHTFWKQNKISPGTETVKRSIKGGKKSPCGFTAHRKKWK